LDDVDKSTKVNIFELSATPFERPVAFNAGIGAVWAAPFHSSDDTHTVIAGAFKRFVRRSPEIDEALLDKFSAFVSSYIKRTFVPIPSDSDTSVATWLDNTNYPLWRKNELLKDHQEYMLTEGLASARDKKCKSFRKWEFYPSKKHARVINSRTDRFKWLVGPIFKLIEKDMFSLPDFIKKVSIAERPKYIHDRLYRLGAKYYATDFEGYESLFVPELMRVCEMQLYEYMTRDLPEGREWFNLVSETMCGENLCEFRNFIMKVRGKRMSGEMCTSLGNSFTTLMTLLFVAQESSVSIISQIEGDDSLNCVEGGNLDESLFERLGFRAKIESYDNIYEASFCGIIFTEEAMHNLTDPADVLGTFGWMPMKYARSSRKKCLALARCKALSFAHQYPGCPIVDAMAHHVLRLTRSFDCRHILEARGMNMWERDQLREALSDKGIVSRGPTKPHISSRLLVESKFGIPCSLQICIEDYFNNSASLAWDYDVVRAIFPDSWLEHAMEFTRVMTKDEVYVPNPTFGTKTCVRFEELLRLTAVK